VQPWVIREARTSVTMKTFENEWILHTYHRERNHQGIGNELIQPLVRADDEGPVRRRQRIGSVRNYLCSANLMRPSRGLWHSAILVMRPTENRRCDHSTSRGEVMAGGDQPVSCA
jgi:hypothetical protein